VIPIVPKLGILLISEGFAVERTKGVCLRVSLGVRLLLGWSSRGIEQILRTHQETKAASEHEEGDD
jgi:hypothetical protein